MNQDTDFLWKVVGELADSTCGFCLTLRKHVSGATSPPCTGPH